MGGGSAVRSAVRPLNQREGIIIKSLLSLAVIALIAGIVIQQVTSSGSSDNQGQTPVEGRSGWFGIDCNPGEAAARELGLAIGLLIA